MNYSTTQPQACTHRHTHTGERKGEQEVERGRGGESVRSQDYPEMGEHAFLNSR